MKKPLLTILILLFALAASGADSFYSVGGAVNTGAAKGEDALVAGGIYFDTYYAYPQEGTDLAHGFGTMLEATLPGFRNGAFVNIMVGYALEWDMTESGLAELYMLLGPSLSCRLGRPDDSLISLGGGIELNGNFYFDKERTLGISVGIKGNLEGSSFHHSKDLSDVKPLGWLGAHVGFAVKVKPSWENLPSHSYAAESMIKTDD